MVGTVEWLCQSLGCHVGQARQMWDVGMGVPTSARGGARVSGRGSVNERSPMVPDCGGLRSAGMWLLVARPNAGLLWLVSGLAGSHDTFRTDGKGQVLQGPALGTVTDLMFSLGV